jgi:hypothetical protein
LGGNKLAGAIPDELYSLSKLESMLINLNPGVSGTISPLISKLSHLRMLNLGLTGIGGPIPDGMFSLTDLGTMNLESAAFSGTIPESFGLLNFTLRDLLLRHNNFTGRVPDAFDHLTALGEFVPGGVLLLPESFVI